MPSNETTAPLDLEAVERDAERMRAFYARNPDECWPPAMALADAAPALCAEVRRLRAALEKVANHEWIIATAFRESTKDFGWQVNVKDGAPQKGSQHYRAMPETFAATPHDAALLGLAAPTGEPGNG